jgi:heme/copper-type cytochrome/quinol oxidase subunit 2
VSESTEASHTPQPAQQDAPRSRWKDILTLHLPLVIVVSLSVYATINQYQRWSLGVDRSFVYMIEWPIIGLFAIFVWNRYRKHGNFSNWLGRYYRERAARFEAEAEAKERAEREQLEEDPETQAWQAYVQQLQREDPPGGPPQKK